MGPDDFIRRPNGNSHPRPAQPTQRPIDGFGRPQPKPQPHHQKPIHDFGPPPSQHHPQPRHIQDLRPNPTMRTPIQHQVHQNLPQTHTQPNHDSRPNQHVLHKEKSKNSQRNKLFLFTGVILLFIVGVFIFTNSKTDTPTPVVKAQPSVKPLVKPDFTVYYPTSLPNGLEVSKGSIVYYKDSFTFILKSNGQNSFFVYEQPASTDPKLGNLKSKLSAPKTISLSLGQGVTGDLGNGSVVAVETKENTLIIVNCTRVECGETAQQLLKTMQTTTDLDELRKSNS